MTMAIIEVDHVTKEFQLGQLQSLKTTALNGLRRIAGKPLEQRAPFKALDDVSFSIDSGEVVGIIGQNGAGKSTLLKLLANISKPTSGRVAVNGSVAPLIEVGAGLIGDLTGRENIYLNGSILGIAKTAIARKFDEIVAFAELEEFIDTPIKRYSSGMQVRLGFSIATSVDSDILIVDEVLAVGDLAFQRKCFDRMEDLINRQNKTVLLVSHNIRQVERLCKRAILLEHGRQIADGNGAQVCNLFFQKTETRVRENRQASLDKQTNAGTQNSGELSLEKVTLLDASGRTTNRFLVGDDIAVSLLLQANDDLVRPAFGIGIQTMDFVYLTHQESFGQIELDVIPKGSIFRVVCRYKAPPLLSGVYTLRVGVGVGELMHTAFYAEDILPFQIEARELTGEQTMRQGLISTQAEWSIEPSHPAR
jgi:ABC-type polysaccharide/polyol phosphate transport system ATPase subunit